MPNHVTNVIRMEGISNEPLYNYFCDRNNTEIKQFDFNKIIPMPESLDIESMPNLRDLAIYMVINILNNGFDREIGGLDIYLNKNFTKERFMKLREFYKSLSDKQLIELGLKLIQNKALYGYYDWYGWCNANWDTKWNSYSNVEISEDEIKFDTAWNEPTSILRKLSEMYPNLAIQHWWAEEFIGSGNSGYRLYKNGCIYGGYDKPMSYESLSHYAFCFDTARSFYPYEGNAIYNLGDGNAVFKLMNNNENSIFYISANQKLLESINELLKQFEY